MIVSRPVKARAMRMASIVASEPEFTKRHLGSLKFFLRCSATIDASLRSADENCEAELHALLDGLDDDGVGVALDHAAEAVVEVADLAAVHVEDTGALAVGEVDRVGVARLVRRRRRP